MEDFFARKGKYLLPNNPEKSNRKIKKNTQVLEKFYQTASDKFETSKKFKLDSTKRLGNPKHFYDDDIVRTISEEFLDRISVVFVIGDLMRFFGGIIRYRSEIELNALKEKTIYKIKKDDRISRNDISEFSKVKPITDNFVKPMMNGGHIGEHWNNAEDGFYYNIENCKKFIIGIQLGFKADEYGRTVSEKLIKKKQDNPEIHISILIDGFVSIFLQKPPSALDEFQYNTLFMIHKMKQAGINVRINDSWNPLSSDFLAANHVKLWIFDGEVAFYGGIGIESQFKVTLFDQMDLVKGPFVNALTSQAILMLTNQKRNIIDKIDKIKQVYEFS